MTEFPDELPRQHTCAVCGKISKWTNHWSWYGSYLDLDEGGEIVKTCSEPCAAKGRDLYRPRSYKRQGYGQYKVAYSRGHYE